MSFFSPLSEHLPLPLPKIESKPWMLGGVIWVQGPLQRYQFVHAPSGQSVEVLEFDERQHVIIKNVGK